MSSTVSGVASDRPAETIMQELSTSEALAQWPAVANLTLGVFNQLLHSEQTRKIKSGTREPISGLLNAGPGRQFYITEAGVTAPQLRGTGLGGSTLAGHMAFDRGSLAFIEGDRIRRVCPFLPWRNTDMTFNYDCRLSEDRIAVDLGRLDAVRFESPVIDNDVDKTLLGQFFANEFTEMSANARMSTLLEVSRDGSNPLLEVDDIDVRVQREPSTNQDHVVLLVRTGESSGGNYPTDRFINLLPDDLDEPCTAGIAVDGTLAPMASLVGAASKLFEGASWQARRSGSRLVGMDLIAGQFRIDPYRWTDGALTWSCAAFELPIAADSPLTFDRGAFGVQMSAARYGWKSSAAINVSLDRPGAGRQEESVSFDLDLGQLLSFWGSGQGQMGGELYTEVSHGPEVIIRETRQTDPAVTRSLSDFITFAVLNTWLSRFGPHIDPDVPGRLFDNIRMSNGQSLGFDLLDQRGGHQAGFGRAGVGASTLALNEQEVVLAAGSVKSFSASPAKEEVLWSVRTLDGSMPGQIDPCTGEYTAPVLEQLSGRQAVALVSCQSRSTGFIAESVVTIPRQQLALDTSLLSAIDGEAYTLAAARPSGEGNDLEWSVEPAEFGELTSVPNHPERRAFTRAAVPDNTVRLARVRVRDPHTGAQEDCVVVLRNPGAARLMLVEHQAPQRRVRIEMWSTAGAGGLLLDVEWEVLMGGSAADLEIDDEGIWYTQPESFNETAVVIRGTYSSGPRSYQDSIELTLPLRFIPGDVDARKRVRPVVRLTPEQAVKSLESEVCLLSNSKNQILTTLRQSSVLNSSGFGAVWAMSRSHLNRLLEAQYIERFARREYLPLVSGNGLSIDHQVRVQVDGLELGSPQLSFDNASMIDSSASIRLPVVSGVLQVFERLPGCHEECVVDCHVLEEQGLEIKIGINLDQVSGVVDGHGKISLDMRSATEVQCEFADWHPTWAEQLGRLILAELAAVPMHRATFGLSLIDSRGLRALAPLRFQIRTQAAPGPKLRGAGNLVDGAVLVFLQLTGDEGTGVVPGADFPYLLPDDTDGNGQLLHSFTFVLAQSMRTHLQGVRNPTLGNLMLFERHVLQNIDRHDDTRDLVMFGHIEPHESRFQVHPRFIDLRGGGSQQFSLVDTGGRQASVVGWRCIGRTSHSPAASGTISSDGRYQAASRDELGHDRLAVMVVADYEFEGGLQTACALVHVNFEPIAVQLNAQVAQGGEVTVRGVALDGSSAPVLTLDGPVRGELLDTSFTPFEQGRSLAVQGFTSSRAGDIAKTALLMRSGKLRLPLRNDPVAVSPASTLSIAERGSFLPGLPRHTYVAAGDGALSESNRWYTAPDRQSPSTAVIVREVLNGKGIILANNCIIARQSAMQAETSWTGVTTFKVGAGKNLAKSASIDGGSYQQLLLRVEVVATAAGGSAVKLSDEDLATMEFRGSDSHATLGVLPEGAEHIVEPLAHGDWRTTGQRNNYDLAPVASGASVRNDVDFHECYLQCAAQPNSQEKFYASFKKTGLVGGWWTSLEVSDVEGQVTISVATELPSSTFTWSRIDGGSTGSGQPTDNDFINYALTTDCWILSHTPNVFRRVGFIKVDDKGGVLSSLYWVSGEDAELMHSRTGVIFKETPPGAMSLSREQVDSMFTGEDIVWDPGIGAFTASTQGVKFEGVREGDIGFVLQRLFNDKPYGDVKGLDKFSDFNNARIYLQLVDQGGRVHRRIVSFGTEPSLGHPSYGLKVGVLP